MARRKTGLELLIEGLTPGSKETPFARLVTAAAKINKIMKEREGKSLKISPVFLLLGRLSFFFPDYILGKAKIHVIGPRFGEHLNRTSLDLPVSLIPYELGKTYWIELPDSLPFKDESGFYRTECFVYFGMTLQNKPSMELVSFDVGRDGKRNGVYSEFCLPLDPDSKISDLIDRYGNIKSSNYQVASGAGSFPNELVHFVSKVLLYIISAEPDLKPEKGAVCSSSKPKKIRRHLESVCPYDTVLVGYDFHQRHRHIDSSLRSGHFRWQRFGPELSKVKLIWIDETEVIYRKDDVISTSLGKEIELQPPHP